MQFTEATQGQCPLCDQAAQKQEALTEVRATFACTRCGTFEISGTLLTMGGGTDYDACRPYLSCHTRQATELGSLATLTSNNWSEFAELHRRSSPLRQAELALGHIVRKFEEFRGGGMWLDSDEGFAFDAINLGTTSLVIEHLHYEGLIERLNSQPMADAEKVSVRPTLKGTHRVWSGGDPTTSSKCFVAMSFSQEHAAIFTKAIEPAILECGYEPIRVDQQHYNDKINDKIIAEIRGCKFMVADFTGHKGGVYFEAGFARGLERGVIFTCSNEEDERKGLHFDTRDYNHILWNDFKELRERLTDRIKATIGQGPLNGQEGQ